MDNMDGLVKQILLTIFVLIKPPVFLTLSILIVIIYMTFVITERMSNFFILDRKSILFNFFQF